MFLTAFELSNIHLNTALIRNLTVLKTYFLLYQTYLESNSISISDNLFIRVYITISILFLFLSL